MSAKHPRAVFSEQIRGFLKQLMALQSIRDAAAKLHVQALVAAACYPCLEFPEQVTDPDEATEYLRKDVARAAVYAGQAAERLAIAVEAAKEVYNEGRAFAKEWDEELRADTKLLASAATEQAAKREGRAGA